MSADFATAASKWLRPTLLAALKATDEGSAAGSGFHAKGRRIQVIDVQLSPVSTDVRIRVSDGQRCLWAILDRDCLSSLLTVTGVPADSPNDLKGATFRIDAATLASSRAPSTKSNHWKPGPRRPLIVVTRATFMGGLGNPIFGEPTPLEEDADVREVMAALSNAPQQLARCAPPLENDLAFVYLTRGGSAAVWMQQHTPSALAMSEQHGSSAAAADGEMAGGAAAQTPLTPVLAPAVSRGSEAAADVTGDAAYRDAIFNTQGNNSSPPANVDVIPGFTPAPAASSPSQKTLMSQQKAANSAAAAAASLAQVKLHAATAAAAAATSRAQGASASPTSPLDKSSSTPAMRFASQMTALISTPAEQPVNVTRITSPASQAGSPLPVAPPSVPVAAAVPAAQALAAQALAAEGSLTSSGAGAQQNKREFAAVAINAQPETKRGRYVSDISGKNVVWPHLWLLSFEAERTSSLQ